ncbi:MAG: MarR family transcriptional regulator [Candidatus Thorarchaeota archaeon]|nr:MarR family transcriptional regulator [Candidatus Thorarchaeota archaeon]
MDEEVRQKMFESFSLLFLLSQRFEYISDSLLSEDGLTTKQLLALVVIERGFDHSPAISEVAEALSTSHQNVKQIALQLKKKGFVDIVADSTDRRRKLLTTTKFSRTFFDSRAEMHARQITTFFSSLSDEEMVSFHSIIVKLLNGTSDLYQKVRGIAPQRTRLW